MNNIKYIILEDGIPYDWDDYDAYADVLYDIENKKIVIFKYGHGSGYEESKNAITLAELMAQENPIVDESDIKRACINGIGLQINYNLTYGHAGVALNVPCHVRKSCRLISGDCILLNLVAVRSYKVTWKVEWNYKAVVYSPSLNKVATISAGHVTITDEAEEMIKEKVIDLCINNKSVPQLAHMYAYVSSYSSCDRRNLDSCRYSLVMEAMPFMATPDISTASNPQQEEKNRKHDEAKAAKMPDLIAWAKERHPEYTEDEAYALAEKVWNKNYGYKYC